MKYIISIRTSTDFSIWKVKGGGRKKKSQMAALRKAANNIGPVPKKIAKIDTRKSRMNDTA
jgi:hypothetical protein